ncbi:hypothetical protein C9374_008117 [Naegleria lovaniensis]|uniref:Uncharacterized protein n=1 Tax=Naegleria lovaniensis TaxID=51637 RepID=A0AA88KI38_NAELO|nr:uncharacterized protein C9374_008117 [Naegleria lovaniensis]KAG2378478.1 hypothetical protein C9374_008117 [Naegleria lovaniensis]
MEFNRYFELTKDKSITWTKCSKDLDDDYDEENNTPKPVYHFDCAVIEVPLDWTRLPIQQQTFPSNLPEPLISIRLKRISADDPLPKGQLWLHVSPLFEFHKSVDLSFEKIAADMFQQLNREYDIFIPSIRGSQGSKPLYQCKLEIKYKEIFSTEKKLASCLTKDPITSDSISERYGIYFRTDKIALDLLYVVGLTKYHHMKNTSLYQGDASEFTSIHYGYGYNTLLINEMMRLEHLLLRSGWPIRKFIDMVILDSLISPITKLNLLASDMTYNNVANQYLAECDENEFCRKKFKQLSDTKTSIKNYLIRLYILNLKKCSSMDASATRVMLSYIFFHHDLQNLILPFILRVIRCNHLDVNTISNFYYRLLHSRIIHKQYDDREGPYYALERNIACNEMIKDFHHIDEKQLESDMANFAEYQFITGMTVYMLRAKKAREIHQLNTTEDHQGHPFVTFNRPMLMMQGSLDPISHMNGSLDWRDFYIGTNLSFFESPIQSNGSHYFVLFPFVGHLIALRTKCSLNLMTNFIKTNGTSIYDKCLDEYNFTHAKRTLFNNAEFNTSVQQFLQSKDPWDNGPLLSISQYHFMVIGFTVAGTVLVSLFSLLFSLLILSWKRLS